MRSAELARLAGVSVRTLRHYHQLGILAEPSRGTNGYRDYDVHDLIRVLRITRVASLGVALERMPEVLDGAAAGADSMLDDLDAELAAQIARLERQRALIAQLRRHGAAPDVPPELAPFLAAFAATGMPPELARMDRDQSVLLAHLAGTDGITQLARVYARISDPSVVDGVAAISVRFGELGPHSTAVDIAELVESFLRIYAPLVAEFAAGEPPIDLGDTGEVFSQFSAELLNTQQQDALAQIEHRIGELFPAEDRETVAEESG